MGKTVVTLASTTLPPRLPSLATMLVDLAENVHVHYREVRQEFSVPEFYEFVGTLGESAEDLYRYLAANPEYKERAVWKTIRKATGAPTLLDASPSPTESAYWPERLLVELIEPHEMGDVHLHWRDYRLQLTRTELRALAGALAGAVETLDRVEAARYPEIQRRQRAVEELRALCEAGKDEPPGAGHYRSMAGEDRP